MPATCRQRTDPSRVVGRRLTSFKRELPDTMQQIADAGPSAIEYWWPIIVVDLGGPGEESAGALRVRLGLTVRLQLTAVVRCSKRVSGETIALVR